MCVCMYVHYCKNNIMYWKDTKVVCVLESEVEPDKEGVINGCQYLLLSADILHLLLLDNMSLVQDLHYIIM